MLNHYNTHLLMIINGVWPSGKATGFDPVMRRFESYHPSQLREGKNEQTDPRSFHWNSKSRAS